MVNLSSVLASIGGRVVTAPAGSYGVAYVAIKTNAHPTRLLLVGSLESCLSSLDSLRASTRLCLQIVLLA